MMFLTLKTSKITGHKQSILFNECHKIPNTSKRNQQNTNNAINRITYSEGIKFLPFWEGPDDGERVQDSFAYSNPIKVEAITLKKHKR